MHLKSPKMNRIVLAVILAALGSGIAEAASTSGAGSSGQGGRGQGADAGSHGARTTIAVYVPAGNDLCRQSTRKGGCAKPESSPKSVVCYYTQPNFGGAEACSKPGTLARALPARWNDRISSVRIIGSARIELCTDKAYDGRCVTMSTSAADLSSMDNRASSLRILD